uniref:GST N-terminal domain-containing protein n=1 Tax=Zooxanthella nutricula TaxID=1333877 RepID=A0A7S2LT09_9DINO
MSGGPGQIELTYFAGFKGRGEPARIALHASGKPWTDKTLNFEEFGKAKANGEYPMGLPVMALPSGKVVTQSVAMARYAGKLGSSGLYPADPEVALVVDVVMDICQDALTKCPQDPDEAVKKAKREEYAAGKLKGYMDALSKMIDDSGGPFFTGKDLTVGDLVFKYFLMDMITSGMFDHVPPEYVKSWEKLVSADEAIAKHKVVIDYEASKA